MIESTPSRRERPSYHHINVSPAKYLMRFRLALGNGSNEAKCQSAHVACEDVTMASLQLFNGETTFATEKRREAVRKFDSPDRSAWYGALFLCPQN